MSEDSFVSVTCSGQVFDASFHSSWNFLALGLISGEVELWETFRKEENRANNLRAKFHHHKGSCRGILPNATASSLFSVSSDKSWLEINESGSIVNAKYNAHESALNRLQLINEHTIATGDDQGIVKVWDTRSTKRQVMTWDAHSDFISSLQYYADQNCLISAGGDATLCVYDIRNQSHFYKSDDQEAELTGGLCVVDDGRRVAVGGDNGAILLFKWGDWGDCSDRMVGHPEAITSLAKFDERTLLTGCEDGLIRLVQIRPQKLLGVLADLNTSVEGLVLNESKTTLAAFGQNEEVRLFDLQHLLDDDEDDGDAEDDGENEDHSEVDIDNNNNNGDDIEVEGEEAIEQEDGVEEGEEGEWEDVDDVEEEEDQSEESEGDSEEKEDEDGSNEGNTVQYQQSSNKETAQQPSSSSSSGPATSKDISSSGSKKATKASDMTAATAVATTSSSSTKSASKKRSLPIDKDEDSSDEDDDSDDDDDSQRKGKDKNSKKKSKQGRKLPTANERFYEGL